MAETLTANYSWTKPDPGASANTWGATLNKDLDAIDSQVFVNAKAGVPIGSGALWFTSTPPTNWLICDGSNLSTSTYAALFAAIGYTYGGSGGNFNLPNLINVFPYGGPLASTGGEASHTLTEAELAQHAHSITDVVHTHSAAQAAHSHYVYQDAHSHGASQDAHNHTVGGTATTPGSGFAAGAGAQVGTGTTSTAQPAVHIDTQQPGVHADTQQPGITVYGSGTGLSATNPDGGGAAHNNMPPYLGVNFIIKYA